MIRIKTLDEEMEAYDVDVQIAGLSLPFRSSL